MGCAKCATSPDLAVSCCGPHVGSLYIGQAAAGQAAGLTGAAGYKPAIGLGTQPTIPENPTQTQCDEWWGYLEILDASGFPMDAVIANMRGLPHNNARFLEQITTLAWYDRENVYRCARKTGAKMITDAVAKMTPEEKAAAKKRTADKLKQLQAQGKFKDGKLVIQDPGELRSAGAYLQIQQAIDCDDSWFCGSTPIMGIPVPKWALWAGGAWLAFTVYKGVTKGIESRIAR